MNGHCLAAMTAALVMSLIPSAGGAQGRPDPAALMAAQREAMKPLAAMDGVWRGPAWTILESGEKHNVTPEGYVWEIPAGPMTIRYSAVIKDGKWREVGDRIMPGRDPVRFFEMNLVRIGNSDWPASGTIPQK